MSSGAVRHAADAVLEAARLIGGLEERKRIAEELLVEGRRLIADHAQPDRSTHGEIMGLGFVSAAHRLKAGEPIRREAQRVEAALSRIEAEYPATQMPSADAAREELRFIVVYLADHDQDANHAWMVRRIRAVLDGKSASTALPWQESDGVRAPRAAPSSSVDAEDAFFSEREKLIANVRLDIIEACAVAIEDTIIDEDSLGAEMKRRCTATVRAKAAQFTRKEPTR